MSYQCALYTLTWYSVGNYLKGLSQYVFTLNYSNPDLNKLFPSRPYRYSGLPLSCVLGDSMRRAIFSKVYSGLHTSESVKHVLRVLIQEPEAKPTMPLNSFRNDANQKLMCTHMLCTGIWYCGLRVYLWIRRLSWLTTMIASEKPLWAQAPWSSWVNKDLQWPSMLSG